MLVSNIQILSIYMYIYFIARNTSMENDQNLCNSSNIDDVNCWRTTNFDAIESKKVVHSNSVTSSTTDLCPCQTIKIFPNPDIQRRVSTDGVSLTKSPRFTDLSWSNGKIFRYFEIYPVRIEQNIFIR